MKTLRASLVLLMVATPFVTLTAQDTAPGGAAAAPIPLRPAQELEQLVGPIALYPDALIALILPASTVPADVVLAARHLRDFPSDRSQIEHRAWDESVKSLTHYPEVLKWMDENLQWTKQLGEAFATQPADVMQAVQRLRAKARTAGTLVDTPQQLVIAEPQVIRIVPAQPDVIYVPHYEPEVVFVDRPVYYPRPFVTFGVGVPVGSWLAFDCDWRRHSIWVGNRHRRWTGHDWRRPVVPIAPAASVRVTEVRQWRPPQTHQHHRPSHAVSWTARNEVARPSSFGTTPTRTFTRSVGSPPDQRRHDSNNLPRANPLPQATFSTQNPADLPGPRIAPQSNPIANVQPLPTARQVQAPNPAPITASPPANPPSTRGRTGGDRSGDRTSPRTTESTGTGRTYQPRSAPSNPLPTAPALPMASAPAPRATHPVGPSQQRVYSRSAPAPATVPALPMATPPPTASVGPTAPAPAPAAAPAAPPRSDNGERRSGRRSDPER